MRASKKAEHEGKKHTRRLAFAAAGMFAAACCIVGGLFYLNGLAKNGAGRVHRAGQIPDISASEKQQFIARATLLRDKWRPWALQHRTELQQMLSAQPGDQASLNAVLDVLPRNPTQAGLTGQDLMPSGDPFVNVGFGWAPVSRGVALPETANPDIKLTVQKIRGGRDQRIEDDFSAMRDTAIAGAIKGQTFTTLWASGRITVRTKLSSKEREVISQKVRAEGRHIRESDIFTPHREIVPPYDFLAAQKPYELNARQKTS